MRRPLIAIITAILFFCFLASIALAQETRKNVNDLTAAEVAGLRRGVAVMMSRNGAPRNSADFRRSWSFWANMHEHFGDDCAGPRTGQGMSTVREWTASNAAERATWCGCVHKSDSFLTWHRMYVYYFERVLQQAAGMPSLRLPYWDYATSPSLPSIFRSPTYTEAGVTVRNPLYRADRRLNTGGSLAAAVTSANNAMAASTYTGFRTRIESTPHGAVHCALAPGGCPAGLMGSVAAAANDPIFWLHHSNVDRLYDCWLRTHALPSASAVVNARFSFIDREGSVVTRRAGDMLRSGALGYRYSGGCGVATTTTVAQAGSAMPKTAAEVPVRGTLLRIDGVNLPEGAMYEVTLVGPRGTWTAGVLSSFGAGHHGTQTFEFDVSEGLRIVGAGKRVAVALVPTDGVAPISAPRAVFGRMVIE